MSHTQTTSTTYIIRVAGRLDTRWSAWFDGWQISHLPGDETTISGPVRDQAELHGLLNRLFGLNLTLLAVYRESDSKLTSTP
jgi:hypothetical protein